MNQIFLIQVSYQFNPEQFAESFAYYIKERESSVIKSHNSDVTQTTISQFKDTQIGCNKILPRGINIEVVASPVSICIYIII